MLRIPAALLPLVLLVSTFSFAPATNADESDIVCDTIHEPVAVADTVYVLQHHTRCYHPEPARKERLASACSVLLEAYGPEEGEKRCGDLLARIDQRKRD